MSDAPQAELTVTAPTPTGEPTPEDLARSRVDRFPILRYFAYAHLPEHLQAASKPFAEMAHQAVEQLPPGPEVAAGLRKLLEAKDCFVRAAIK